ncbi:QWRF motif-containing protein 2 [Linum grandiflorum]
MVAEVSRKINPPKPRPIPQNQNPARPPLLPSESDNALALRRPRPREVTSRYMSSSSSTPSASKRCPSPLISRPKPLMTPATPSVPSTIKRSQSVERMRSRTPTGRPNSVDLRIANGYRGHAGTAGEMSNAQKQLITSTRSMSVSFQGDSFALRVSKAKPAPSPISARKGTPERRKATTTRTDQAENNSRSAEQQRRWPGRLREQQISMSKSMDCTDDRNRTTGSRVSVGVVRALQSSRLDSRSSIESKLSSDSSDIVIEPEKPIEISGSEVLSDPPLPSDTESVSSATTSEGSSNAGRQPQRAGRVIVVPAKFRQETNNAGVRRKQEPVSPSMFALSRGPFQPKIMVPKKLGVESPVSSPKGFTNTRGQSPMRTGGQRPASPRKPGTMSTTVTPMRGTSPSRTRDTMGYTVSSNMINFSNTSTSSILSFGADIRRGRCGETRLVEVHFVRILYNRLLQWRFVNARADAALSAQRLNAEKSLYCAHLTTTRLRESVRSKRTELQLLRQNMKLDSILRGQMKYLEDFAVLDQNYSCSLSGATEALQASTLRLPVVGGARADALKVRDAICSAVDVMQAMGSSIRLSLSRVGEMKSLVAELGSMSAKELVLLDECRGLLSNLTAIQVKECSLRTHIAQQEAALGNLAAEV